MKNTYQVAKTTSRSEIQNCKPIKKMEFLSNLVCTLKQLSPSGAYRKIVIEAFSNDVTVAVLVFQNNETAAMLVY